MDRVLTAVCMEFTLAWGGFVALRPLVRLFLPQAMYPLKPLSVSVCVCIQMYACLYGGMPGDSDCNIALRMTLVEALRSLCLVLEFVH